MWLKLVLLILYGVVLFFLSRFLETVAWYENGYWSKQLLDPFSLSVKKLKSLLDQRGVSYAGVVEKSELSTLVDDSGETTEGELNSIGEVENATQVQPTTFTCGAHFYERVEDNKDSVWLVQVVHPPGGAVLSDSRWKELVQKLAPFGIHVGVFDCSNDYRFCAKKSWHSSRLMLAIPQGHWQTKDQVKLLTYSGLRSNQAVFDWVNFHLASRIHAIGSHQEFVEDWMKFNENNQTSAASALNWPIHVILLSKLLLPPMFLSVLSVRFTGRVKFGKVDIRTHQGKKMLRSLQKSVIKPSYIIITPERTVPYGKRRGEVLNYFSFDLFLRTMTPDINDLFKLGMFLTNCVCVMGLITDGGGFLQNLTGLIWRFIKYNCLFMLLWLPIIGLFHIPQMSSFLFYAHKFIRIISCTDVAGYTRQDVTFYFSKPLLVSSSLGLYLLLGYFLCRRLFRSDSDIANTSSDWWSFSANSYLANYLFHPVNSLTRPAHAQDLEEGMELLIERLAVPNLWLQPIISNDYVKNLPIWIYTEHTGISGEEDGKRSDSEGSDTGTLASCSSNNAGSLLVCEHCNATSGGHNNRTEKDCIEYVMDSDYRCMCENKATNNTDRDIEMKGACNQCCSASNAEQLSNGRRSSLGGTLPDGMLPAEECVICLDSYRHGNVLCGLPCGHNFHENCIMGWIIRDNHCCPVCRWPCYKSKCKLRLHYE